MKLVEDYEAALAFIHGRTQFKKIPTLQRMAIFMEKLGHPEQQLKVIHVAGTNGKGSTVAFLRSLLMATGQTVGTFTSPFLMRFNERISIDNQPISDDDLIDLVNTVQPIVAELDQTLATGGPTEFEIITAMMFCYFAQQKVDVAVVEVGIGGKFDSTNVLTPVVSVITTIGMDHMKLLGDTLPKIAAQKAGIIKAKRPVIIGRISEAPLAEIKQVAESQAAPIDHLGEQYQVEVKPTQDWGEKFDYQLGSRHLSNLKINLMGAYQVDNAANALSAFIRYQELTQGLISADIIREGLQATVWPGRFELISEQPRIVLDGAHNAPAMQVVTKLLKTRFQHQELYVVLAILADKAFETMVKELLTDSHVHIILTTFVGYGTRHAVDPESVIQQLASHERVTAAESWQEALAMAMHQMSSEDTILVTGSLYFISEVRQTLLSDK